MSVFIDSSNFFAVIVFIPILDKKWNGISNKMLLLIIYYGPFLRVRERALTTTTIEFKLTQQVTFDESLLCLIRTPFFLYLITSILLPEVTGAYMMDQAGG